MNNQRYLIITDLHEDLNALDLIKKFISLNIGLYNLVSLGDAVGFHNKFHRLDETFPMKHNPNECVQYLRRMGLYCLLGNHEVYHLFKQRVNPDNLFFSEQALDDKFLWDYSSDEIVELSSANKSFIRKWRSLQICNSISFSHFLFQNLEGCFRTDKSSLKYLVKSHFYFMSIHKIAISFMGHIHLKNPLIILESGQEVILNEGEDYKFDTSGKKYIVFCPFSYSYYDNKSRLVSFNEKENQLQFIILK